MRGRGGMRGGVHGGEGVCGRGACMADTEIPSMSGRYASYWKAFLLDMLHVATETIYPEG